MQYLYRAYNFDGVLLYVGISGRWSERLHEHEKTSEWMVQTDYVQIERFANRRLVEEAEKNAIEREFPIHNKAMNLKYESAQKHFIKLRSWLYEGGVVDETHTLLVHTMRGLLKNYPFDVRKSPSTWAADIFRDVFDYLAYKGQLVACRNCEAVRVHKSYNEWADIAAAHFEERAQNGTD
jgi:hypothetical protein